MKLASPAFLFRRLEMWPVIILAMVQAAYGQANQTCNDITVGDYAFLDPSMSLAAAGIQRLGLYDALNNPNVNVTLFLVDNKALIGGAVSYLPQNTNLDKDAKPGSGAAAELIMYVMVQGSLSPDDLAQMSFVNSALGQAKGQDWTFSVNREPASGTLVVSSMLPNDTARVVDARQTCNGWVYKMDSLIHPAVRHTNFFNHTIDVPVVIQVLLNGDRCSETLPQGASRVTNASLWPAAWEAVGLGGALANESLVATLFVPQDAAVGAKAVSLETVLYNMVPGQRCADRFLSKGSMNSMLGILTGRNLPLQFTNETGVLTIKGASNSAQVVGVGRACNSLVFATDAVLEPPPLQAALPRVIEFPQAHNRHLTCVPPSMLDLNQVAQGEPPAPPDDSSGGDTTALAIGLGVGLSCAAVLAAAAVFIVVRRKRRRAAAAPSKTESELLPSRNGPAGGERPTRLVAATKLFALGQVGEAEIAHGANGSSNGTALPCQDSSPSPASWRSSSETQDMWEFNPNDLEIALGPDDAPIQLGRGSFGAVYRGMLRGVQPAAIKVLSAIRNAEYESAIKKEVTILKRVNRDRNVVQLYGTARMPDGKLLMVTEFMDGGDLRAALTDVDTYEQLAWHRGGKRVALDIARGLTALHANRVAHRDLKSKNILLTAGMTAKIADVGIAAVLEASKGYLTPSSGGVLGTLAWSAPEMLLGERCSEKVDIYSLGIILWELGTGAVPQRGLTEPPPPSERCPAELAQLIMDCTQFEQERRPTAREIYERILPIPPVFQNQMCTDITVGEYPSQDSSTTLSAGWVKMLGMEAGLSNPDVPVTVFYTSDDALRAGVLSYYPPNVNLALVKPGSGAAAELGLYLMVQGALSPDDLVEVRTMNSALGQAKGQDWTFSVNREPANGTLVVSSMLPNNTARVVDARQTCNGWAYKLDRLLYPAPQHTNFFNHTIDVPAVIQVLLNGDRCSETLSQGASRVTNASLWPAAWEAVGLGGALANESLVATLFVPQDAAVGAKAVSLETVLYNMVPWQRCAGNLVDIGSANSMLGILVGRNLPLQFTSETGVLTIKGASNSAQVVGVGRACNSVVFATDAVLVPPPLQTAPTQPIRFPSFPNRHLTCVPPTMPERNETTVPSTFFASPPPDASSGGDTTALAIGLGVGLGCAAALLAAAVIIVSRRHGRKEGFASKATPGLSHEGSGPTSGEYQGVLAPATAIFVVGQPRRPVIAPVTAMGSMSSSGATPTSKDSSKTRRSLSSSASYESADMWELNPADLDIALGPNGEPIELGRGSFGAVYRGMLRGVQPAAIKVLSAVHDEEYEAAVKNEVTILKRVNRDRNVVQLYGTARMPDGKLLMVTEFMEGGNLRTALSSAAFCKQLAWHHSGKRVALDIARGLTALHANRVAHRDLKSKNILLTADLTAKIADVGIAAVLEASKGYLTPSSGGVLGTLAWSAPEMLLGERCSEKVDIYSLGIILWELGTGAVPQRGLTEPPPPSERCPAELAQLIAECTKRDPETRPTAREVYECILTIPPTEEV